MSNAMSKKKDDSGAFIIPCTIGTHKFDKALCDLDASINLMSYTVYENLGLGASTPTIMRLLIAYRSIKKPIGVLYDVLVKVDRFILPMNFIMLDYEINHEISIILGRPFMATGRALVDIERGEMIFWVHIDGVSFRLCKAEKQLSGLKVVSIIDVIDDGEEVGSGHLKDPT
ncbi:uncharacterized protein LOC107872095 [Capsicum annuum]|uniref:uncharacterized protein LOC107872095 n=1 Tax=Capsicum annuum TaxID=4072 RepID=UPI0007BF5E20|nr:uncharacterized protein LOC107872095 [Capsicum annuum]